VARFSPLQLSGVGLSIGVDRLFAALDELGLVPAKSSTAAVGILDFEPTAHDRVLALASELRRAGVATTLYLGHDNSLKSQLTWAVKAGFPHVILMGAAELERGVVQLKNMNGRTQEEVLLGEVADRLRPSPSA
jgi:histidyl-tRNA synthetase